MSGKIAVVSEYNGGFVGTDDEILEWIECNSVSLADCRFYEVGDELVVTGFTFAETT